MTHFFLELIIRHPVGNYKRCTLNHVPMSIVKNIVDLCIKFLSRPKAEVFCLWFIPVINYTHIRVSAEYRICKPSNFFTLYPFWKRVFGDVILHCLNFKPWKSNISIMVHISLTNNFWIGHTYWKDNLHNVECLTDWKHRWVLDFVLACLIPLVYRRYQNALSLIQKWETSQERYRYQFCC